MTLTIDITSRCPLACEFCYQTEEGELSCEKILSIVDKNPKFSTIELGGGEPLAHPDILYLLNQINQRRKRTNVATNGVGLPRGLLDLDEKVRQDTQIQVSLHAANKELYQNITGYDFFNQVLENISSLKSKFPTSISTTAYKANFRDIPNVVNLALEMQLPIRVNLAYPIGRGKNIQLLNPREVDQLRGYLLTKQVMTGGKVTSILTKPNNCEVVERFYGLEKKAKCPLDTSDKLYVTPSGKTYACEMQGKSGGNQ